MTPEQARDRHLRAVAPASPCAFFWTERTDYAGWRTGRKLMTLSRYTIYRVHSQPNGGLAELSWEDDRLRVAVGNGHTFLNEAAMEDLRQAVDRVIADSKKCRREAAAPSADA